MTWADILSNHPYLIFSLVSLLSLSIGSFLNVVIYRLPLQLRSQWELEIDDYIQTSYNKSLDIPKNKGHFNLSFPASFCPKCNHPLKLWENIPLISFLLLKGRCAHCKEKISPRYPLVELLCLALSVAVFAMFGFTFQSLGGLMLTWVLLAAVFIDLDHQLLPDQLTLPLLWLGLIFNFFGTFVTLQEAVIGAIAGYLILWSIFWIFKLTVKKEGMGYGDFKLLAALGAWFGWESLLTILLIASVLGVVINLFLIFTKKQNRETPIPFGPYLAFAGWIQLLFI